MIFMISSLTASREKHRQPWLYFESQSQLLFFHGVLMKRFFLIGPTSQYNVVSSFKVFIQDRLQDGVY